MMRFVISTVAASVALALVGRQAAALKSADLISKNRPVSKVINVLQNMQKSLEEEQHEDESIFDRMACWCKNNDKEKTQAIADAEQKITQLHAQIEELTATAARLAVEIENLKTEIAAKQQSLAEATAIREKELAIFNEEEKDMLQSIESLKAALTILSKHNTPASAFAKISTVVRRLANNRHIEDTLSPSQRAIIGAFLQSNGAGKAGSFLQERKDYWDAKNPNGGSYANQSGEIFGILGQMLDTFQADLSDSQKTEQERQRAFIDLKAAMEAEIAAATHAKESKIDEHAKALESNEIAKGDLDDTTNTLDADTKYLMNLKQQCAMTDSEWATRQQTRADEMKAISEAIAILGDDAAHDVFTSTFNEGTTAFLQLSGSQQARREAAAKALIALGKPELAALAVTVRLDAFTKVKKAIDDMIADLTTQQRDEVKKRDWCISSITGNEKANLQKNNERENLQGEIAHLSSEIDRLTTEIDQHQATIAEVEKQIKRAGEDREKENAEFQRIIQDQNQTLQVLQKAIQVLAKVYKTAEQHAIEQGGAALTQIKSHQPAGPPPPAGFDTYKAKEGGGVIEMLNHIVADAESMKRDAIAAEANAQKSYETFVQDANNSKEQETLASVNKSAERAELNKAREGDQTNLSAILGEIERIGNENRDLHTQCDFLTTNFDTRQDSRQQEIDALNTAKAILSGSNFSELLQEEHSRL